jgi:hypothetical protein
MSVRPDFGKQTFPAALPVEGVWLARIIGVDVDGTNVIVGDFKVGVGNPAIVSSTMVATTFGSNVDCGVPVGILQATKKLIKTK